LFGKLRVIQFKILHGVATVKKTKVASNPEQYGGYWEIGNVGDDNQSSE